MIQLTEVRIVHDLAERSGFPHLSQKSLDLRLDSGVHRVNSTDSYLIITPLSPVSIVFRPLAPPIGSNQWIAGGVVICGMLS